MKQCCITVCYVFDELFREESSNFWFELGRSVIYKTSRSMLLKLASLLLLDSPFKGKKRPAENNIVQTKLRAVCYSVESDSAQCDTALN